jgi:DNA-binding HxlR family transcriptional regulator
VPTRTAAQQRADDRERFDAFLASCPTHQVIGVLATKWVALVLALLSGGAHRYAEIQRAIPSISPKVLTQVLRTLERDGLVRRTVTAQVPVRVDYELSPLGADLAPLLRGLKAWSEEHIGGIVEARDRYDATAAPS